MSLYNLVFGINSAAPVLLAMLGVKPDAIPRFRDCYLDDQHNIVIYTRTGGGNRDEYESPERRLAEYPDLTQQGPFNADLRTLPGFLKDEDDAFDSTYAKFYFEVPAAFKHLIDKLPIGANPEQRWQEMLARLNTANPDDPQVKKLTDAMRPMFDAIQKAVGGTF